MATQMQELIGMAERLREQINEAMRDAGSGSQLASNDEEQQSTSNE
jgi:hypothetical protein